MFKLLDINTTANLISFTISFHFLELRFDAVEDEARSKGKSKRLQPTNSMHLLLVEGNNKC